MGEVFILLAIATDPLRLVPMALLGWFKGHGGVVWWAILAAVALGLAIVTGLIVHGDRLTVGWVVAAFLLGLLDAAVAALIRKAFRRGKSQSA